MKSDLSRDTFERARHFSSVRLQQGRIVTDADWNEQASLTRYRAERAALDLIGGCGAPVDAAGYALVAETNALAVHAVNANVVWIAAADGALLRTTNGGADWTRVELDTTTNPRALAEVGGTGWVVGDGGLVRKTSNQGASWVAQNPGTLRTLRGVSVFDADHAWAVGDGGIVVATSDGGATWRIAQTSATRLHAVRFIDELAGLAAGQGGAILATSDGGQTWTEAASGTHAHLRALAVFGTTLAWAAGQRGTIVRSQDGGATWLACNTPSNATLYAIAFRDQNEGWAAGEGGVVLHTSDGGANWSLEDVGTQSTLRSLSFFGSDPGWLVGDGSAALRIGGGSPDVADVVLPAINLWILPGRMYVKGTLCELEARASYGHQPDGGAEQPLEPGGYLMYLDVWQHHVSALELPIIREVALGGPDTATRARTIAQVRALPLPPSSPFDWNCSSTIADWDALVEAQKPVLAARAEPQLAAASLCEIAATAGYRRLENQLYRVEVHEGGANPTFKWSRENGSVAYAVESISIDAGLQQTTVRLAARGRDANLDLTVHDRVELVDDDAELVHRAGAFFEYLNDGNDALELVLAGVPPGTLGQDPSRRPILRRWDHKPTVAGANVLPIVEGPWIELEEGVQVRFGPGGQYRPGDYWQIPARTITADVEWPRNDDGDPIARPPAGIADAYCRLGIIEVGADGTITVVADCRNLFPPVSAEEQLLYVSGDGQDGPPDALLPQPLAARVARGDTPVAGRVIRFEIESGGGTLGGGGSSIDIVTDSDGQALCEWRLGPGALAPARFQRVRASLLDDDGQPLPGQYIVFCATASLFLRYVSGDGQSAAAGAALPFPLEVQVVNGADGVAGALVRATVEQGGGAIAGPATRTTDAQGQAAFGWQLGSGGPQRVRIDLIGATGQVIQRLAFDASIGGSSNTTRGCDVTIGIGGDFEKLTADLLRGLLEGGRGNACVCFLPGSHDVAPFEIDGVGQFRLSLRGCGHASQLNVLGTLTFDAFLAIELRDLTMRAEGDTQLLFRKNNEVRLANVLFDRSGDISRAAAVTVVSAQSVSMTGCEILTRFPSTAAMFQDINGACRVIQNRFVGLVSFYGDTEEPPAPDLLRLLAARDNLRLRAGSAQLSFCDNQLSQLSVATVLARRLAQPNGTANGVFASAIVHGNTFVEQNSLFVAGLLGVDTNAFIAQPTPDGLYGVMMATRATAAGNLAVIVDDRPLLQFVVPNLPSFAKAANEVTVRP
jgi:photosystem II stability/assembly factor-like uncharacterized protein